MSEEPQSEPTPLPGKPPSLEADSRPIASSSLYRLAEEMIALRELNNRQHRMFEKTLKEIRDDLRGAFNSFAADTQRAYQELRKEVHGEKRISLNLMIELLDICQELEQITAAKPAVDNSEAVALWMQAVEIEARKVQESVQRHGILPYDAVIASPYNPALHERVGTMRKEGMGPLLIAEQKERGWASQLPEFVLRRPKVIVSE